MASKSAKDKMVYRRVGRSGLQVSVLSFGSWVSFDNQMKDDLAMECMQTAYDAGCNLFDNAEAYAAGESEAIMGRVIRELGWRRSNYVLTSKFFWGIERVPNMVNTLNRKYLMQAVDGSLERFGVDFLDLIYCHRADPNTPIEETVRAMHDIIASGKALYWGTSEWKADEIRAAWEIAERHHLHKPVVEQPEYNLFSRRRVEKEYARLYTDIGLGTTIFSPLASGLLTGKYQNGIPDDSRGSLAGYEWLGSALSDRAALAKVDRLRVIADELGCTLAQMCLAWCASNPNVSSVITGASRPSQVAENFAAIDVLPLLTPEILSRIDKAVA